MEERECACWYIEPGRIRIMVRQNAIKGGPPTHVPCTCSKPRPYMWTVISATDQPPKP